MSDRLNIALQMFHKLRLDGQIEARLYSKYRGYADSNRTTAYAICLYAAWPKYTRLITSEKDKLYLVSDVRFQMPRPLDMKPTFLYDVRVVSAKLADATLLVTRAQATLLPENQAHYRLATESEIIELISQLPVIKRVTRDLERV